MSRSLPFTAASRPARRSRSLGRREAHHHLPHLLLFVLLILILKLHCHPNLLVKTTLSLRGRQQLRGKVEGKEYAL
jgi:hypothetical protein